MERSKKAEETAIEISRGEFFELLRMHIGLDVSGMQRFEEGASPKAGANEGKKVAHQPRQHPEGVKQMPRPGPLHKI